MPRRSDGWLFAEGATIHDVVDAQRKALDEAIANLSAQDCREKSADTLAAEIIHKARLDDLYWPDLDIDLAVDSLTHPQRYPLISQAQPHKPTKASTSRWKRNVRSRLRG
jgi:hypothetical protein